MLMKLNNIGDSGVVCDFGDEVNQLINNNVIKFFQYVRKEATNGRIHGILNCTPSYNKLIINFDPGITNIKNIFDFLNTIDVSKLNLVLERKERVIPICYDFEMDLTDISKKLKINKDDIIKIHSQTIFYIYMIGFVPGHPFMGDLDHKLYLNRLETPRVKVPAGSVGIVEKFCNIYPYESPGGWNIIGRTPIKVFNNKNETTPCLLSPGDTIKFKSISKKEFDHLKNEQ